MDSKNKQELLATIAKQAEQIKRYEGRLRDVVTAYKGLAKQKETLERKIKSPNLSGDLEAEASLSVLNISQSDDGQHVDGEKSDDDYKTDIKITKDKYEKILEDLRNELSTVKHNHQIEVNNLKAKLMYEVQEREKETANQAAMLKEFNMKMNIDKRFKDRDEKNNTNESQLSEMEKRVRDLHRELEATQRKLTRAEARTAETPQNLVRLHEKIALIQQTHTTAIREEQIKAKRAEEAARKSITSQEERVAVLEAKLAELSHTVGEYDLLRRRDQQVIQRLKETLNSQILANSDTSIEALESRPKSSATDNEKLADTEYLKNLIDKIHILKTELIAENQKLDNPVDISAMFSGDSDGLHVNCKSEYSSLKCEYELLKQKLTQRDLSRHDNVDASVVDKLKREVKLLNERIRIMDYEFEDSKHEWEVKLLEKDQLLESERKHNKEMSADLRNRIIILEKQIQVQRDKYSALLDESERYIKTRNRLSGGSGENRELLAAQEVTGPPHMLHYSQELARKDLDISQLRKEKHQLEGQLRDTQRDRTIEKERYKEVIKTLREEIDRMRRCQSREGANLEYLKNVVLSYISSTDRVGKRHMLNAIAAVLHFTEEERHAVYSTI